MGASVLAGGGCVPVFGGRCWAAAVSAMTARAKSGSLVSIRLSPLSRDETLDRVVLLRGGDDFARGDGKTRFSPQGTQRALRSLRNRRSLHFASLRSG